jgi:hypothetical protein
LERNISTLPLSLLCYLLAYYPWPLSYGSIFLTHLICQFFH